MVKNNKLVINGPVRLHGTVAVGGSKNAALPILAASLLARQPVQLQRVPQIRDVAVMLEILEHFGMQVKRQGSDVVLDPAHLALATVPPELARSLRASILLLGPALARFGRFKSVHPGGDVIGKRPLDTHFKGLEQLGATVSHDDSSYQVAAQQLTAATVFLEEASVTATENVLMAAAAAAGTTVIKNAASELHVRDLAAFLNTLGAKVSGAGTNQITVTGVSEFSGGRHQIRADELEAATFAIAAAVTGGDVTITGVDPEHFGLILIKLREAGVRFDVTGDALHVHGRQQLRGSKLKVEYWPGFPTDLQPPFTVLMTQAEGMSLIHDHMYEGRFFYTDKLVSMGANITMADPHRIIVWGPTKLRGKELESPDIRAGISLLVAALVAEGKTVIDHAELIDRGYERIDERLRALGADITRLEETDSPV